MLFFEEVCGAGPSGRQNSGRGAVVEEGKLPIEVPLGLLQVLELGAPLLIAGAAEVLDGVAQAEGQLLAHVDGLNEVARIFVVLRVVDVVVHLISPLLNARRRQS